MRRFGDDGPTSGDERLERRRSGRAAAKRGVCVDLAQRIVEAVNRHWSDEVEVIGTWSDRPMAVCIVYRRAIDPAMTIGCRVTFSAAAADGTVEGFARDVAINLAEPIGAQAFTGRRDTHGIVWVAIPDGEPLPEPPPSVVAHLRRSGQG